MVLDVQAPHAVSTVTVQAGVPCWASCNITLVCWGDLLQPGENRSLDSSLVLWWQGWEQGHSVFGGVWLEWNYCLKFCSAWVPHPGSLANESRLCFGLLSAPIGGSKLLGSSLSCGPTSWCAFYSTSIRIVLHLFYMCVCVCIPEFSTVPSRRNREMYM